MAIGVNGGDSGAGRFGSRRRAGGGALSEINVTPFVDVVLVLLIIFMLTAHVMEFGIDVDVPHVKTTQESSKDLPVLSLTKDGALYLNDQPVNINEIKPAILRRYPDAKGVYVRAHRDTIYEPIAQIVSELNTLGFQVLLVTQPEEDTKRK